MKQYFLIISVLIGATGLAQDKKKWDVNKPPTAYKSVSFSVNEGTWMNVDISPDGKTIVFDLLGDIYAMPASGGSATVLRQNLAFEVQPQFSPDGTKILFTSDAGGGDNIWVMDANGSNAKQVTKESFRLLNNAVWSPDGQYIVARKHFTSGRSLGAGEMWMYHISGGDGLQLTARKNDQQDVNEPCFSPDGRYVYYSEDVYPGGFFQYNKDPNNQIFVIKRFDRDKGVNEQVTGGPGGACRPQISHGGQTLAFVKRIREKSVLYLRNLETAEEWPVYDKLSKDQQEAWTTFGVYPRFTWTPDDKYIIVWSGGKILKVNVNGANDAVEIPFTASVTQQIAPVVRFKQNLNPEIFDVHVIRNAVTSPDEKYIVFNALGYLWKKELPSGKPMRLTKSSDQEAEPSFSPDGKQLVFVSWNDTTAGSMYVMNTANFSTKKITSKKAIYRTPSFSPDGKKIVFVKEDGDNVLGPAFTSKPGIYTMDASGANEMFVSDEGSAPAFNKAGDRIYYQSGSRFGSCNVDGEDARIIFKSTYGSRYKVSPDGNWVAFIDLHKVYVAAFPGIGKTIDLSATGSALPLKVVSKDAGINLHWSSDSKTLHYTLGSQYYSIPLKERFGFIANVPDSSFIVPEKGIDIGLAAKTEKPSGTVAFTNARIITMNGNEVIENGVVIVEGNVIKAVGKKESVSIPSGALEINCTGKTITPGFIDAHAHGVHFRSGLTPQKHWPYYTALAYGTTTMHDPSANSEMVFAQSELLKSGQMVGPRVFSTGTILYGADGDFKAVINSLDDARSALRRTMAFGAFSVKSYNQPRREQNQQVLEAARELKINVVPEGGSFFYHNLAMINDGHTTIEHNLPIAPLYADVLNLWKNSETAYTPTLIVSYGAPNGEYYWYQHGNIWEKERLMRFTPRNTVDARARWRTMLPEAEYKNGHILISESCKKLTDLGVHVNTGAHGQIQGIGEHWEIWMLQQGGMSNLDALKAATISPAISLGFDDWIGSIQPGKLADLLVMDKNPLESIYNTESIKYTMVNGHLYDAETMNELTNGGKARAKFYWEAYKHSSPFNWNDGGVSVADED